MPRRLLSTGFSIPACLCLLASCCVASCCAVSDLHHLLLHSLLLHPSLTLHSRWLGVVSNLVALPPLLYAPLAQVLPLAAPLPYIYQLALSCTTIFGTPSLDAVAIAGILKRTVHPLGGGSTNSHCPLLLGSRPLTHTPAPPHHPICFH